LPDRAPRSSAGETPAPPKEIAILKKAFRGDLK
jgi:hypothetical protein